MAKGKKTGGRAKGTPNKVSVNAMEKLEQLGCDPIEGMALIAMDEDNPIELRSRMYRELAQYVVPKRKALEVRVESSASMEKMIKNLHAGRVRVANYKAKKKRSECL